MPRFFARHAATLFFPMALILYDFAAYLSTDLIQPGIINVVRDFNADVSLDFVFPIGVLRTRSCLLCHVFLPAMPPRCFSRWR